MVGVVLFQELSVIGCDDALCWRAYIFLLVPLCSKAERLLRILYSELIIFNPAHSFRRANADLYLLFLLIISSTHLWVIFLSICCLLHNQVYFGYILYLRPKRNFTEKGCWWNNDSYWLLYYYNLLQGFSQPWKRDRYWWSWASLDRPQTPK